MHTLDRSRGQAYAPLTARPAPWARELRIACATLTRAEVGAMPGLSVTVTLQRPPIETRVLAQQVQRLAEEYGLRATLLREGAPGLSVRVSRGAGALGPRRR